MPTCVISTNNSVKSIYTCIIMLVLLGRWTVLPLFLYTYSCEILSVCIYPNSVYWPTGSLGLEGILILSHYLCLCTLAQYCFWNDCSDKPGLRCYYSIIYCFLFQHDGPIPNDNHKDVSFLVRVWLRRVDSVGTSTGANKQMWKLRPYLSSFVSLCFRFLVEQHSQILSNRISYFTVSQINKVMT